MKAGLFGGDWDDISGAIDDQFNGLTDGAPDLPPSPGPDAPFGSGYSSDPNSLTNWADLGWPITMIASGNDGAAKPGAQAPEATTVAASAPGQSTAFYPATGANSEAIASPPMATPGGASAGGAGFTDVPASGLNPYSGIDYTVIAGHEGSRLDPYVPPGSASSGVTVATGVDLSEHTAAELRDWGVSEDAIAKLSPFLKSDGKNAAGPKGDAAQAALTKFKQDNPTSGYLPRYEIDLSDALAMNNGALRSIAGQVQQAYDAASPPVPFLQLAAPVRTAILDLAYQYGPGLAVRAPAFWKAATTGDWNGAADELHNWTAAQKTDPNAGREQRRLDEEALIRPLANGFQPSR